MIVKPDTIRIENFIDPRVQIQGAGIDLTLRAVERFAGAGAVDFDNSRRELPPTEPIPWIEPAGAYLDDKDAKGGCSVNSGTTTHDTAGGDDVKHAAGLENAAFVEVAPGGYIAKYNEVVEVPKDALGIVLPRSSMMRSGATIFSAVWDPGYRGRGMGLMVVTNPLRLYRNARICQIFFVRLEAAAEKLYDGKYQGEGTGR
jgi:dUTP pyrophosphatase